MEVESRREPPATEETTSLGAGAFCTQPSHTPIALEGTEESGGRSKCDVRPTAVSVTLVYSKLYNFSDLVIYRICLNEYRMALFSLNDN